MPVWSSWTNGTAITGSTTTCNTDLWRIWQPTSSTTGATTIHANVWNNWNTVATGTACTAIHSSTWTHWLVLPQAQPQGYVEVVDCPAERARQQAEMVARAKATAEAAAAADAKAKKLLLECVSPEQRATIEQHGYFDVTLPNGNVYRIKKGWSHNVQRVLPNGQVARGTLCAHPVDSVPNYDNMLAQKFMLETDEQAFLRIANRGGGV